jgi:hypothetical protein
VSDFAFRRDRDRPGWRRGPANWRRLSKVQIAMQELAILFEINRH